MSSIRFSFQASFSIRDYVPLAADSSILAPDNSYIDIEFNDQVFGNNDATGLIEVNDIIATIICLCSNKQPYYCSDSSRLW